MYQCILAACSESAMVDRQSNSASIINIIEEFRPPGFPFVVPKITCFFLMSRDQGDNVNKEFNLIISLDDNELQRFPITSGFADKLRNRILMTIHGFVAENAGLLKFAICDNETEFGSWNIPVFQTEGPTVDVTQDS